MVRTVILAAALATIPRGVARACASESDAVGSDDALVRPSGAPWTGSDLPLSAADDLGLDERHRVWHGLLLTGGVLLVIYPSIRSVRSDRRRMPDEAT
jgi:hypothetical protein